MDTTLHFDQQIKRYHFNAPTHVKNVPHSYKWFNLKKLRGFHKIKILLKMLHMMSSHELAFVEHSILLGYKSNYFIPKIMLNLLLYSYGCI